MNNPWHNFIDKDPPYVLLADQPSVFAHNKRSADNVKIQTDRLPEPYLGRPDAPVVLLNLRPSYTEKDFNFYEREDIRSVWRKNLLQKPQEYPFYLLDPDHQSQSEGAKWWRRRLHYLIASAGPKKAAHNICCIEYNPYPSLVYKRVKGPLVSQQYNLQLVRKAMARGAVLMPLRSEKIWLAALPELASYKNLIRLRNLNNPVLSRGNCSGGYTMIEGLVAG